ncbi:probable serine/threonine-protein kinase PBL19 [Malus sylvestris]|uniref:probable serine/threonine-protein kinase PBL19 n=1 Tax=Malus sylvestris TaxID=3752 RepID=UPI0021ABAA2A|nr:probable serine/threonine-protein kinase PBL19 [Malus sylvestris]
MKCFFPFKEKRKSKKEVSQSAPELRNKSNPSNPALDRATKSSSSLPSPKSIPELYKEREHNLRVFSFQELREATNGFSRSLKLGEGGFGRVYKAAIRPSDGGTGSPIWVAIKKLNPHSLQGHKQWLAEVQFLGVVNHPNLVKLLGYCCLDGERGIQRLLVYEFMPNRSLEDHLFNRALPALPWMTRLKIMLGAAQGLAYLHKGLEVQVIYRDFKSSNVLLDEEFRPKLSDFGLAREGPTGDRSHVSTSVVGTYGYAAPEYLKTGHLSISCDLWSFGVVLYEILTGRRVLDKNRPISEQKLLYWVRQFPADSKRFSMVIDPLLRDQYSLTAAQNVAKLADSCLNNNSKDRPTMSQVVEVLEQALRDSQGSTNSFKRSFEVSTSKLAKRKPK